VETDDVAEQQAEDCDFVDRSCYHNCNEQVWLTADNVTVEIGVRKLIAVAGTAKTVK